MIIVEELTVTGEVLEETGDEKQEEEVEEGADEDPSSS
jgi:hypothetical protein